MFELEGESFERVFMQECNYFVDAKRGVDADQIMAALLLRDAGKFEMLDQLHQRKIQVIGVVDEDSTVYELEFQAV